MQAKALPPSPRRPSCPVAAERSRRRGGGGFARGQEPNTAARSRVTAGGRLGWCGTGANCVAGTPPCRRRGGERRSALALPRPHHAAPRAITRRTPPRISAEGRLPARKAHTPGGRRSRSRARARTRGRGLGVKIGEPVFTKKIQPFFTSSHHAMRFFQKPFTR